MNSRRLYYLLTGAVVILALTLVGGAYGVNALLQSQSHTLADLEAKNDALNAQQTILAKDKRDLAKYASLNDIAKSIVPQDKNQAEAVREIVNIANQSGIALGSITFPQSTLGKATGKTTTSTSKLNLSQLTPVKDIPGVYDLQITVESDKNRPVAYSQFVSFLERLENNRRTAQVSSITLNPNGDNRSLLTFTLIINEYIKP